MTEEQAIEVWRELAPLDAMVRRIHCVGANDPAAYDVALWARRLSGKQLVEVIRTADAHGLEVQITVEGAYPLLSLYTAALAPVHPKAPQH